MIARASNVGQRRETCDERADRLWLEPMHEVRVVLTAVQLLLAFLLAVAFTPAFGHLGGTDRLLYVVCGLCGVGAMAALTGLVALHRLVTGLRLKPETVAWASRLVTAGMALLPAMTSLGILVLLRQVTARGTALLLDAGLALWCGVCWLVPAALLRRRPRPDTRPAAVPEARRRTGVR
ncbi:DUF6328 family protein [Streptomyces sp. W1SF4]|uniref:DUF6328 family protein n=1 Tax=Streptomyces sp. W1SF4 TaxID=2305220 RepID=UPI0019D0CF42|nr:DUF6328 family protein [Streptomyces sp. W1SF4]